MKSLEIFSFEYSDEDIHNFNVNEPRLPRKRKATRRLETGAESAERPTKVIVQTNLL